MEGFVTNPILPRPNKMIEKLTEVPRSRLEVFFLKRLLASIMRINSQKDFQMMKQSEDVCWSGLFDLISASPVANVYIMNNQFYLGYLKNKEQTPEKNVSGKLLVKILEYEDTLPELASYLGEEDPDLKSIKKHEFSPTVIKHGLKYVGSELAKSGGKHWKTELEATILSEIKSISLEDMVTLKASSSFGFETFRVNIGDISNLPPQKETQGDSKGG